MGVTRAADDQTVWRKDRGLPVALDPDDGLAIARQRFGLLRHKWFADSTFMRDNPEETERRRRDMSRIVLILMPVVIFFLLVAD